MLNRSPSAGCSSSCCSNAKTKVTRMWISHPTIGQIGNRRPKQQPASHSPNSKNGDVIVLDDSSDASSGSELTRASACTSPAASPAVRRRLPIPGYQQTAVEAALAMAAALQLADAGKGKKKKMPMAPPLVSAKPKRPVESKPCEMTRDRRQEPSRRDANDDRRQSKRSAVPRPKEKDRREFKRRVNAHVRDSREVSRKVGPPPSRSNSSVASGRSKEHRVSRRPTDRNQKNRSAAGWKTRFNEEFSGEHANRRRRTLPKPQAAARSQAPAEVVDLRSSSSSSSESSSSGRSRSSSMSSSSSGMSSDSDVAIATPAVTGRKRLVLNDRVPERVSRPNHYTGTVARSVATSSRQQLSSYADDSTTDEEMALARGGERKRKRVIVQRSQKTPNRGNKRDRAIRIQLKKKINSTTNGVRLQDVEPKRSVLLGTAPSSSSSSSSMSSDESSPRLASSRQPRKTVSVAARVADKARNPEARSLGETHRNKSTTTGGTSSTKDLPPSYSPDTVSSLRKKRRVGSFFDTDRVALDDIQAQERELAWIQAQHRAQSKPRTPKPAAHKRKTCREVIYAEDHSNSYATVCTAEPIECDLQTGQGNEGQVSAAARSLTVDVSGVVLHPTSYRGVYCDKVPGNILPVKVQLCRAPFESDCDQSLTFYDKTHSLERECVILKTFGKTTPCVSSVFPSGTTRPQSDVTRSVNSLILEYLPTIRHCHRRKGQAILREAREKVVAYRVTLAKLHKGLRGGKVQTHLLSRSTREKHAAKLVKTALISRRRSEETVSFQITRNNGLTREKSVQVNHLEKIQSLRPYTTSIGLRSSYRVEDNPILRYSANSRPSGTGGEDAGDEVAQKYGLSVGNVADEEVIEYVLRLVVARLGDSEQVFHALRSELDFSQAYTVYSELKKLHDSRERAGARLDLVRELIQDGDKYADPEITALANLMKQSSLSPHLAKTSSHRLQPPLSTFESNIVESMADSATAGMAALGLRATDSYDELVDVYCGSFCRMCYRYGCHEHGGEQPLPARRVDPAYPSVHSVPLAALNDAARKDWSAAESSNDGIVHLRNELHIDSGRTGSEVSLARAGVAPRPRSPDALCDPSEFIDGSHVSLVAMKLRAFLSDGTPCGEWCRKRDMPEVARRQGAPLTSTEQVVLQKLRETLGNNSCLLSAVMGSASCEELYRFIERERRLGGGGDTSGGRSNRRTRNWKLGRRSGGSNHELVQRTRNQRLQDRGTSNHEYKPCMHEGMCDSTGCSCMKRDHRCEKACACSRDCPNRFEGCTCSTGSCRTSKCPCFVALRECDPDVCLSCGASEAAVSAIGGTSVHDAQLCGNISVTRIDHKRLAMSFSAIHGWGIYAKEAIASGDFVYEYTRAVLSQDEAERRGFIYDTMEMSYLFDLNEDAVLDALRCGNKSKFINHEGVSPNCSSKIVSVRGIHHISIWAMRDIAKDEELVFDYGYKGNVGPERSHRRIAS